MFEHDYLPFLTEFFARPEFRKHHEQFANKISERASIKRHGDLPKWQRYLDQLPEIHPSAIKLDCDVVSIGVANELDPKTSSDIQSALHGLSPWRKGPYQVFDTFIDTEWRSDWKWNRVKPHISNLSSRRVLDVGCGTGYHCWRMLGEGAEYVLGIDPSMRFVMQYNAIQHFARDNRFDFLPIGIEDMPPSLNIFDTVFSMGVLYHRRDPLNHVIELFNLLNSGGEVVLETLIVNDAEDGILTPKSRYAQMRNVWSITTINKTLELLETAGFKDVKCVDQNVTSLAEQRRTDWMTFHSLKEFLDPHDITKTIEGYPAPKRGLFIGTK